MSRMSNAFEQKIREAMEQYEMPYSPSGWKDMEHRLNKHSGADYSRWVAGIAAAIFVAGSSWAVYSSFFKVTVAQVGFGKARFENIVSPSQNQLSKPSSDSSTVLSDSANGAALNGNTVDPNLSTLTNNNYTPTSGDSRNANRSGNTEGGSSSNVLLGDNSNFGSGSNNVSSNSGTYTAPNSKDLTVKVPFTQGCSGTEFEFQAVNGPEDGSYLWNFGDGNFSNQRNPKHVYTKSGTFDVSLSITNKKDGQIKTTIMSDFITIYPSPAADFEWNFVNDPSEAPTVKIVNTSENASAFTWKFSDGSSSQAISPIRSYSQKGRQSVVLEVANEFGCRDNKVRYINISTDYNLDAPDKFKVGDGNEFMPDDLKTGKTNFKLTIYNGEKAIYETNNKTKGWNGKMPNGSYAEAGQQFPWIVIVYSESTHEEKYYSGILTIIP